MKLASPSLRPRTCSGGSNPDSGAATGLPRRYAPRNDGPGSNVVECAADVLRLLVMFIGIFFGISYLFCWSFARRLEKWSGAKDALE